MIGVDRIRFAVAGVSIELRASGDSGGKLPPGYALHGTGAEPAVTIDLERTSTRNPDHKNSPDSPLFEARRRSTRSVELSRVDAAGTVRFPDQPGVAVAARFQVGESVHSTEAVIRAVASQSLPRHDVLLFHASAAVDPAGKAWLFAGESGAGKSTLGRLLDQCDGWSRLADELVAVSLRGHRWYAHTTPFLSKVAALPAIEAELAAVQFLEHDREHSLVPVAPERALPLLMRHVLAYVADAETASHILRLCANMVEHLPCHLLRFAPRSDVKQVLSIT